MARQPLQNTKASSKATVIAGALVLLAIVVMGTPLVSSNSARRASREVEAPIAAVANVQAPGATMLFSDEYVASLMDIPEFATRARSGTVADRRELAMALAARGVSRLDDEALVQRASHLAAVLDRLDDSLCFAVAVGMPLSSEQWRRLTAAMDQTDSLGTWSGEWGRAYRAAIVAELDRRTSGGPRDPAASTTAVAALRRICNDEEREVFTRAGEGGGSLADFAAGLRLTYRKLPELSRAEQTAVLRMMVQGPTASN
jgi:hypothetical protein